MKKETYIILNDIRSVINVGAIFRTADACAISKIYLTGYTPMPIDRFGRIRKDIAKASLGSEKTVAWEHCDDIKDLIKELKEKKVELVAVEQSKKSIDYKEYKVKKSTAFIFGNEIDGVPKDVLERVDAILEIYMMGDKESLNVSVSAGIVLFRVLNI